MTRSRLTLVLETEEIGPLKACIDAAHHVLKGLVQYRLVITLEEGMDP